MLRARYLLRLSNDVVAYTVINRVWWLPPLLLLLALTAVVIVAGQVAAPFGLYTMF